MNAVHPELGRGAAIAPMRLTRGQRQVLAYVAAGMTNDEIGRQLEISAWSVGDTCTRIRARIGGRNNAQMVALAFAKGLLDPVAVLETETLAARLGLGPMGGRRGFAGR